ncbi:MAG TPA: DUF4835 family protein [Bacteroidales bacterium]|jgi:hypothetical protein|nr:DUF4835 family protein [Bacteroidales bacterium]
MMKKCKWMIFCLLLLTVPSYGQDFLCQLSVNSMKISGSNREKYNKLQQDLYKFINDRKWCQYNLKANERIECSILLTLDAVAGDVLTASMTVQLQRPVFGSNYKTTLLNFQDKDIKFTYEEGQPLEYADNANLNQLTSLIAFYLNLFLAVDFDSFSLNGGYPYYAKCQSIVSLNQNATEPGWKVFETGQKNRYWLMENLTNGAYSKVHEFFYNYHRLGLDVMSESPDIGRASILESLKLLQDVNKQKSNLYIIQLIVLAKSQEIINIFKEGTAPEKSMVISIMKQLDPANQSKYAAINN